MMITKLFIKELISLFKNYLTSRKDKQRSFILLSQQQENEMYGRFV